MEGYNGWKNWETWAAALWIDGEESNYREKERYFNRCRLVGVRPTYTGLISWADLYNGDISWRNSHISRREITESLQDDYADWLTRQ